MHHDFGPLDWVNAVANLGIVAGYLIVPFTVLPRIALTPLVRGAGVLFFVTCAITHLSMALGFDHHWIVVVNHVAQAIAVWIFVTGFARLVMAANRRAAARARIVGLTPPDRVVRDGGAP